MVRFVFQLRRADDIKSGITTNSSLIQATFADIGNPLVFAGDENAEEDDNLPV